MFAFGVISIEVWRNRMPVRAFVLALIIASGHIISIGIIQAITNQKVGLNIVTKLIAGYILPGQAESMMSIKTHGYITMAQALTFTSDLNLGHYMRIPLFSFPAQASSTQPVHSTSYL